MEKIRLLSENILENENIISLIPEKNSKPYIDFLENYLLPFTVSFFKDYNDKTILKKSSEIFKIVLTINEINSIDKFISLFKILIEK